MNELALVLCLIGLAVYLLCDYIERFGAVAELARLTFAVSLLAWFLK